ncbi:plastocyanin/azurin family copper-binding protein [Rubrivirga sp. IMCC43871]|uniref:plastocyanin/azurin family copper-binding protein n=1 Tax=Rubrivirga sp. IMCC43871 TaxID=3391575 RepID=UPI00398FFFCE
MTLLSRSLVVVFALVLAACGGDTAPAPAEAPAPAASAAPTVAATPEAPPAFDGPALEVTLTPVGNTMAFEQTAMTAQPGQTVRLTFNNTADNPAMSHNVVVLHQGADVNAFGQAAMSAEATEYIPAELASQVIAHTAIAAPGETVTVEFTAPAAGTYTYVCTFPGHYMMMTGTLTVA